MYQETQEGHLLRLLMAWKVNNLKEANRLARCGDMARTSCLSINLVERPGCITVCAMPDDDKAFESPNPRFCPSSAGGRSPVLFEKLLELFKGVNTDSLSIVGDSFEGEGKGVVTLSRNSSGDIVIATTSSRDSTYFGAKVFFPRTTYGDTGAFACLLECAERIVLLNNKDAEHAAGRMYIEWTRVSLR